MKTRVTVFVLLLIWVSVFSMISSRGESGNYSWTGTWNTVLTPGTGPTLTLTQSVDGSVTGSYGSTATGRGSLVGTVIGSSLVGTFTELYGSIYAELQGSGPFQFDMSPDGMSFTGTGHNAGGDFTWSGTRTSELPTGPTGPQPQTLSIVVEITIGTFQPGGDVYFSGRVTSNGAGVEGASIEITVSDPAGQSGTPGQKVSDSSGFYGSVIHLPNDASGTYTITVTAHKDGYSDGTDNTSFTVEAGQSQPTELTISVDSPSGDTYQPGGYVKIEGRVSSGDAGVANVKVEIVITDSDGNAVGTPGRAFTDSGGYFTSGVQIGENTPAGTRTITLTASKEGYTSATATADYTVASNEANALVLTVETDSKAYTIGDTVTITGYVKVNNEYASGVTVTITVTTPKGSVGPFEVETLEGRYEQAFVLQDASPTGPYSVKVTVAKSALYEAKSADCSFTVQESEALTFKITVGTTKSVYNPGDAVTVTGIIEPTSGGSMESVTATIEIQGPGGSLGVSPISLTLASYQETIGIPQDALPGSYTVIVKVSKPGYKVRSATASFTVEPATLTVAVQTFPDLEKCLVNVGVKVQVGDVPVQGAKVAVEVSDGQGHVVEDSGVTDESGTFNFYDFNMKYNEYGTQTVKATASKENFKSAKAETSFELERRLILKISSSSLAVNRGGSFHMDGVVTDAKGDPVEGAYVSFWWSSPDIIYPDSIHMGDFPPGVKESYAAGSTSSTGTWEESLEITNDAGAGLYIISACASKEGYGPHCSKPDRISFSVYGAPKTLPQPNIGVEVKCPVNVLITDSNGRVDGYLPNGTFVHDIPDSYLYMNEVSDGRHWVFGLPRDVYNLTITGSADGEFNLIISSEQGVIQDYGKQPISKDANATMILNPNNSAPSLILSNGETVQPQNGSSSESETVQPENRSEGGGSATLMGLIAVIIAVIIVTAVWKRKKTGHTTKPQLASVQQAVGVSAEPRALPLTMPQASPSSEFCMECGTQIKPGKHFCIKCGTPITPPSQTSNQPGELKCSNCGSRLPAGKKFCTSCGKRLVTD